MTVTCLQLPIAGSLPTGTFRGKAGGERRKPQGPRLNGKCWLETKYWENSLGSYSDTGGKQLEVPTEVCRDSRVGVSTPNCSTLIERKNCFLAVSQMRHKPLDLKSNTPCLLETMLRRWGIGKMPVWSSWEEVMGTMPGGVSGEKILHIVLGRRTISQMAWLGDDGGLARVGSLGDGCQQRAHGVRQRGEMKV